MSIKDQLRAAILSGGMNGSAPSTSTSITLADNTKNFVPPCDGYLHFRGELDSNDKWLSLFQYDYGRSYDNTGSAPLEDVIRVRKGAPILFNAKEGLLIKQLKFFKCVGGGKSPVAQLIRRVVPCLRNCLTRALTRTLKAKRTGSGSNLFRLPQPSNINGHRAIGMKSFLLKRGGFPFELRLLGTLKPLNLVLPRTIRPFQYQPYLGTMDTSERPFLSGKGFRSNSRSRGTSLRPVFTSGFIGLRAEPNLCFGGASYE